jgi:hypothetical protein
MAHRQEQLDVLADYFVADAAKVIGSTELPETARLVTILPGRRITNAPPSPTISSRQAPCQAAQIASGGRNGESCLGLVRALAVETHENWLEQRRSARTQKGGGAALCSLTPTRSA